MLFYIVLIYKKLTLKTIYICRRVYEPLYSTDTTYNARVRLLSFELAFPRISS